jgi:hypothetical protein
MVLVANFFVGFYFFAQIIPVGPTHKQILYGDAMPTRLIIYFPHNTRKFWCDQKYPLKFIFRFFTSKEIA